MQNKTAATVATFTTAMSQIGTQQREAGETSKDIASRFMTAVLAGKLEIADNLLSTIERACDTHKGNKGTTFAFTYAAIAQCRETLQTLSGHADAIGGDTWNKYYDILASQLARLATFMPSSVSDGPQSKNVPLSDMLRGIKSVTRAVARTDLAYLPSEKSRTMLADARKVEAERQANKAKRLADAATQAKPATPATPRKTRTKKQPATPTSDQPAS